MFWFIVDKFLVIIIVGVKCILELKLILKIKIMIFF